MRLRAKVDSNQAEIVKALRAFGCSVHSTASIGCGYPDLSVGRSGVNYLLEVKDGRRPKCERKLTPAEKKWHAQWGGSVHVVECVEDALAVVGALYCVESA